MQKVGTQVVHFGVKFEAAVKILAPNRKCIFKSPVRGFRGCTSFTKIHRVLKVTSVTKIHRILNQNNCKKFCMEDQF